MDQQIQNTLNNLETRIFKIEDWQRRQIETSIKLSQFING